MEKIHRFLFNLATRLFGYGLAVVLFSILWSGLITELNLIYLIPIISNFFDFSSGWFLLLKILFILPFPTAMVLYGAFHRLGIPALFPSFRLMNNNICADGDLRIRDGLSGGEYQSLLKAINKAPKIFLIVAIIEVGYIDIIVLIVAIYNNYSLQTIAWIFFSWIWQTVNYGGVGYVLAETVTGTMRRECKRKLRQLGIPHEPASKSSVKYKMAIIAAMVLFTLVVSIAMTYLSRDKFRFVLYYIATYTSVITLLAYLTVRVFYRALYDVRSVVDNLKERGEGIIFATTMDREIIDLAVGINAASDTITDYRVNLELKVEERTKELSDAKEEIEATMEELEASNETLVRVNRELEDSNRRYAADMEMAGNVQYAFLPKKAPQSASYDIAFVSKPMSGVSGDFYDFYQSNGATDGVGIFDVSGHGISSGLLTLLARSTIYRNFVSLRGEKIGAVMSAINKDLINEIGHSGSYITGILLRFRDSVVEYVNSGHPHLMYKTARSRTAGTVAAPDGSNISGPFLGIELMENNYRSLTIKFNSGDTLLLYTDGLSEATNADGEIFDESMIMKTLEKAPGGSAEEILDYIMEELHTFTDKKVKLNDDLTVIVIKKT